MESRIVNPNVTTLIYCDGASKGNPGPASIGVWATQNGDGNKGIEVFTLSEAIGVETNNVAEWLSLVKALRRSRELLLVDIQVYMDSELVVFQVLGKYKVRNPRFLPYWKEVNELKKSFQCFSVSHIPREMNKMADSLANLALKA